MNIHRRDRARIRHIFSEENQVISSETNTSVPKNPQADHDNNINNVQYPININALSSEDQKSSTRTSSDHNQKQASNSFQLEAVLTEQQSSGVVLNKNPYVNSLTMRSDDHYHHDQHHRRDDHDRQHSLAAVAARGKVVIGGADQEADHRQIPFFVEESLAGEGVPASREEEKMTEELDLELRLGPDTSTVTTTTLSTREFF